MKLKLKRIKIHTIDGEKYVGDYYPSSVFKAAIFCVFDMQGQGLLSFENYSKYTKKL